MGIDLGTEVEQFIRNPSELDQTANVVDTWIRSILVESAFAGTAAEAADATIAASAVATTIGTLPLIGLMVAFLIIISLLIYLVETLAQLLNRIPWVGHTLGQVLLTAFSFTLMMKQSSLQQIYQYEKHLWHNLTVSIGYFAHLAMGTTISTVVNNVTNTTSGATETTNHLQHEINSLSKSVTTLSYYVHHIPGQSLPSDILTLPDQIAYVEAQVRVLFNNQVTQYHELQQITSAINSARQEINDLTKSIYGERAVVTGWQDIVSQIEKLQQADADINAKQSASISTLTSTLAQLAPLTVLLQPGQKGIQTLRKLEDKPCQCPGFPGISGDIAEAFGIYEFLTNG